MERKKILTALETDFTKITYKGDLFHKGTTIYVKEIKKDIFLLINVLGDKQNDPIQAMIANFDSIESVGVKKPIQLLFHLKINSNEDLHYLKTYLSSAV